MAETRTTCTADAERFNDFRLPVLWIKDNEYSKDADGCNLHVHPSLNAINEFVAQKREPLLMATDFYRAGTRFLADAPADDAKRKLLKRDLASRGEPLSVFDLESIPDGPYRYATRELVSVAALADLYQRLQAEPQYVDQLRRVLATGDAIKIHHYWLNGKLGCIDAETAKDPQECAVLDEKPTKNGVWWPPEFKAADVKALKKQKWRDSLLRRKVFSPESRIVSANKGDPDSFAYKGKYYRPAPMNSVEDLSLVAKLMADHLEQAATHLDPVDPNYAAMLRARASYVKSDSLFANLDEDMLWAKAQNPYLSFSLSRGEKDMSPFQDKNRMMATLGFNDQGLQSFVRGVVELAPAVHERLVREWTARDEMPPFDAAPRPVPSVEATNIIFNGGDGNAVEYVIGGFNQPNLDRYDRVVAEAEVTKKLVLFGQIFNLRIAHQGLPLAREIFDAETVAQMEQTLMDPKAGVMFIEAHETAHSLGVQYTDPLTRPSAKKGATLETLYGTEVSGALEEGKSDLLGMYNLPVYLSRGKLTVEQQRLTAYVYLGSTLRCLLLGEKDGHGRGSIYNWKLLLDHSVVPSSSEVGKYRFDLARYEAELPAMTKKYNDTYGSQDAPQVAAFDRAARKSVSAATPIGRAIAKVKKAGGPKMHRPVYVVLGSR